MNPPNEGDPAPDFTLPSTEGRDVTLSELSGRTVVLYFYPKDMTSGCTREAGDFQGALPAFADADTVVYGVSKDSLERHETFRAKEGLAFHLLSDKGDDVCERYGVWKEKTMYGRTFMGIERTTFVIDPEGRVAKIFPDVNVDGHVGRVLEAVTG